MWERRLTIKGKGGVGGPRRARRALALAASWQAFRVVVALVALVLALVPFAASAVGGAQTPVGVVVRRGALPLDDDLTA